MVPAPCYVGRRECSVNGRGGLGTFRHLEASSYAPRVGTATAPRFYPDNQERQALGLVEKDSDMSRVSKLSRTSATLVAAAATLAAMTTYNIYRARKVEREHPPTGRFITVNGIRLHYIERGEGPPVVLLHGNMVTAEDFDTSRVLDLVATQHRVIAFD